MPVSFVLAGFLAAQVPEPPSGLIWEAPPGCPGRAELLAAIDRRLGRTFADEVRVEARVTTHAEAPRYRLALRISVRGRSAVRTLTSQRCPALVDATALLVATAAVREAKASGGMAPAEPQVEEGEVEVGEATEVSLPADAEPGPPEPAGAAVMPGPSPAATAGLEEEVEAPAAAQADDLGPPATTSTALTAPTRSPRRPGGLVRVQGGPELGALPGVTGAVGLVGGLLWRHARLEFRGTFLAPCTAERTQGSLRAFAAMGAVLGCGRLGPRRVEFPLCAGLELGGVRGTAHGVAGAQGVTALWLAVVASAGVAVAVHPRVRVGAALEGVGGIFVPNFGLAGPGPRVELFESSLISGRLLVGVELRFRDPR